MVDRANAFLQAEQHLYARFGLSPRARFIELAKPKMRLRVQEVGASPVGDHAARGEPVILLHGGGSIGAAWVPLAAQLAGRRLLVVDRPGCGLSEAFDYRDVDLREHAVAVVTSLWDALGIDRAHILANCAGGMFALAFCLAHPQRVNRLVLLGAPAGTDRWLPLPSRLLGIPLFNALLAKTVFRPSPASTRAVYERLFVADVGRVPPELLETAYLGALLPGASQSFLSLMEALTSLRGLKEQYYFGDALSNLMVPTLFVTGDRNFFDPAMKLTGVASVLPGARCEVISGAGHFTWLDAPERCAALVQGFLSPS